MKTVVVHPGAFRTASLSPPAAGHATVWRPRRPPRARCASPRSPRSRAETPHLPPPGARPGVLGTLPAKVRLRQRHRAAPGHAPNESAPAKHSGWMIQVGAFDDEKEAKQRLDAAQDKAKQLLGKADPFTEKVEQGQEVALPRPLRRPRQGPGRSRLQAPQAQRHPLHAAEELTRRQVPSRPPNGRARPGHSRSDRRPPRDSPTAPRRRRDEVFTSMAYERHL